MKRTKSTLAVVLAGVLAATPGVRPAPLAGEPVPASGEVVEHEAVAWWKPYSPPCVERENFFEFAEKPMVKPVGPDRYEITFAVKGYCDATVALVNPDPVRELVKGRGTIVRHLASGVLGANAPAPFQKNSLKQTIYWNGKDDLDVYHKEPEKLQVRVSLGLKPEFDKRLGATHPKALPGAMWGVAADADGVYVFVRGGKLSWRKFDHNAKYVKDLYPPSGALPQEKLGGMGYIEYESGKRAIQAPNIADGMWHYGTWAPQGLDHVWRCRPVAVDGRIYLLSSGHGQEAKGTRGAAVNYLHWFGTDGSTEYAGVVGRPWIQASGGVSIAPHLASSPDGKMLYVTGLHGAGVWGTAAASPVLMGGPSNGEEQAKVLVGRFGQVGSDERSFNNPKDVACDSQGRVYVVDLLNLRIQIFSPEGKFLKTLKVDRPNLVQVHQKTGHVYVAHSGTVQGRTVPRITRLSPFPTLAEERHWDGLDARIMTLDSWTPKPRLWISGRTAGTGKRVFADTTGATDMVSTTEGFLLRVYEDDGGELRLISDFEKEAREAEGANFMEFRQQIRYPVYCDPVTERAYYNGEYVFDLRSGQLLGGMPGHINFFTGLAFDKRGYMHVHQDGRDQKFIMRVDPARPREIVRTGRDAYTEYTEVPYDYGEDLMGRIGVLRSPTTDDKYYSWGMGVNMRGEIALLNMYKVAANATLTVPAEYYASTVHGRSGGETVTAAQFSRQLEEQRMHEAQKYVDYIRPHAGFDVVGAVIWTFSAHGELTDKKAIAIGGFRTNGLQLDENGNFYFANGRSRYVGGNTFLSGKGGNFGGAPYVRGNPSPFTGTYIKARPKTQFLLRDSQFPCDTLPARPPDLVQVGEGGGRVTDVWAEGAEWLYAGVSPIVCYHCSCMDMRAALDWHKRSFVPEQYRQSVGILDTAGNLICHVGRYGNLDEGGKPGPDDDGVRMTRGSHVSATDNYLVIADWGRRLIVARLNYAAEESVPLR